MKKLKNRAEIRVAVESIIKGMLSVITCE